MNFLVDVIDVTGVLVISEVLYLCFFVFFFNDTATTEIYTLSLHDALPIFARGPVCGEIVFPAQPVVVYPGEDRKKHTSELQSQFHLVCRLLLEKKKKK